MTSPPPDPRTEKKTALTVGAVLLLIAVWNHWQGRSTTASVAGGLGTSLLGIGLLSAWASRKFYVGWMAFAGVLGYINSRILLSLMFYLMIAPYGYAMRLFGRDILTRRGPQQGSYWIPRKKTRQPREQFERLF